MKHAARAVALAALLLFASAAAAMAGTAYMDDEILPRFAEEYEEIPVLAEKYPPREVLSEGLISDVYGVKARLTQNPETGHLSITYIPPSAVWDKAMVHS